MSPDSRFEVGESKITFADYMLKRYSLTVKNTSQPLLVSGNCFLLPEFCLAVGMTERLNE
jgi:PAZ domain